MASDAGARIRLRPYRRHRALILMVLPGLGALVIFRYVPMAGLVVAFKDFIMTEGILRSPWVGLENFARL
ncbi:MAG TPA: sugar ABC transporter permease, partial [Phycisphaerae bacterium]|nr:sugar ABC transporter permease [Phycisphaerae bacterium]